MITFFVTLMAHAFGRRRLEDHIWIIALMLGVLEIMFTALVLGEAVK